MPTEALISVKEYLRTSYRPDCDYLDGHIEERNLGERDHSNVQMSISAYLFALTITSRWAFPTSGCSIRDAAAPMPRRKPRASAK